MHRSILFFWGLANELSSLSLSDGDFWGSQLFVIISCRSLLGFTSSTAPSCISHIRVGCHDGVQRTRTSELEAMAATSSNQTEQKPIHFGQCFGTHFGFSNAVLCVTMDFTFIDYWPHWSHIKLHELRSHQDSVDVSP